MHNDFQKKNPDVKDPNKSFTQNDLNEHKTKTHIIVKLIHFSLYSELNVYFNLQPIHSKF